MQIVALDSKPIISDEIDISNLKKLGIISLYPRTDQQLIKQRLRGADIVLTNQVPLNANIISSSQNLKLICILGDDISLVDIQSAAKRAIPVCIVPDFASKDIAQHTIALLLEMCSHIGYHDQKIHKGAWCASQDYCWWEKCPVPLHGKTAGIIGCGAVGCEVAKIFNAFGMNVIGYDNRHVSNFAGEIVSSLDDLLKHSDIVSVHCSINSETIGMINNETIEKMKDGVLLLNTASGKIVKESDIVQALKTGKIGGYGADTVAIEPISVHNALLQSPNCILSGHCGCASISARQKLIDDTAEVISAFLSGSPKNMVF